MAPPLTRKYADVYDEQNAELISESFADVVKTGVALRRFSTKLSGGELDAAIREMWAVRSYIDNPQTDRRSGADNTYRLEGRWRVASLRKSGPQEPQGIIEELKYGYSQPPGTSGDYPKSASANDWKGLDATARCFATANVPGAATYRINPRYTLIYPNVAQATVLGFCNALAARAPMVNPTFGNQTPIQDTLSIIEVKNEDQNDGSSIVVATLASTTDPTAAADANNTLSPLSLDASATKEDQTAPLTAPTVTVDPTTHYPSQTIPAGTITTQVSRLGPLGKWSNTTKVDTAVKVIVRQDYLSDGGYQVTMFTLRNVTQDDIDAITGVWNPTTKINTPGLLSALASINVSKQLNGYGLFDGHIHARGSAGSGFVFYSKFGVTLFTDVSFHPFQGKMKKVVVTYTGDIMKNGGVSAGRDFFYGDDGLGSGTCSPLSKSVFRELGRDWYYFMKVTAISTTTTDVTTDWASGTAITTP